MTRNRKYKKKRIIDDYSKMSNIKKRELRQLKGGDNNDNRRNFLQLKSFCEKL